VFPKGTPIWSNANLSALAEDIINKGKSYSACSRGVLVTNDKLDKKTKKLSLAGRSNTAIFAQILLYSRQKLKHRGLSLIKVGSPDWLNLKESCNLASEFCNEFEMGLKEGYTEYISRGLKMMKNFSIFKFKSIHGAICNEYEATQVIERDKTPSKTDLMHSIYMEAISEKIGFSQGYKDLPLKYQYFVKAKEDAEKFNVSQKVYIKAQFQGFEWNNSVPDPTQLVGPKSIDRLQKYAFENNIQLGKKKKANNNINWSQIKNK
jgi:hypothetical protein